MGFSYLCPIILLKRLTDEEDHPLPANSFAYGSSSSAHHTKGDEPHLPRGKNAL
jgi:hypothetical protein